MTPGDPRQIGVPYRTTAAFTERTLPAALTREHRTKPGVWGIVRVFEGTLGYRILDPLSESTISATEPGLIIPDQPHCLVPEPGESFRLQVEFYDHDPNAASTPSD